MDAEQLCPEKVMCAALIAGQATTCASDFFRSSRVRADANVGPSNFEIVLEKKLKMVPTEIDTVFRAIYANSKSHRPVYFFYTYFDQIL